MKYSKKKIKIFTLLTITLGAIIVATSALAASSLSFSLSEGTSYEVGDTFRANIVISPAEKIYTVKAEVNYPADLLKVESFTFNSNWMPISQPGYDTIDNSAGLLIKTAGYPGGISAQAVLGTVTFRVLNSGEAAVKFTSESLVLNAVNTNVADSLSVLNLTLTSVSAPELPIEEQEIVSEEEEEEIIPEGEEEVTPEEEIVSEEEEVVTLHPEEKIPEESLTSLLLASLEMMQESVWITIVVILCLLGLVVIGIKEWELLRKRKKE